ncbi:MAG: threonine dehydratase [Tetrasphaera sp.]
MPLFSLEELDRAHAVVAAHVPVTAAYERVLLSAEVGASVIVKHENHTPTNAFKVRGGLVYLARLARERPQVLGVVSATRGNHGQSLAYAARAAGKRAVIVVPEGNNPAQVAAMRGFGAEVRVHGRDFQEAREHSVELAAGLGLEMVAPFHPDLVLGVATYAKELFGQAGPLDAVYVPVGMGSGICGLITVRDLLGLPTRIVGVVAAAAPATALSVAAGRVVTTPEAATFVDGVACREPMADAIEIMCAGAERIVTVSEDQAAEAMRVLYRTTRQMPEPAGAIALAGLLTERDQARGQRVAVIQTGGNCDEAMVADVLAGATPSA